MSGKPDCRDLIVDCPACRKAVQEEYMDGAVYYEFEPWLRSIRPGSIGRIYRPFLLGGGKGRTDKQRRIWAERADKVAAKGGKLMSISPPLTGNKLVVAAVEEISNVARGRAGKPKSGKPPKEYTDDQWAVIRKHWPRRHGVTVRQAADAINEAIAPRKVTIGWLYQHVK